jgi:microcystin-dependent protein
MPINQNQALFSLVGTMYGGNGQTNFALPDFRGRTPIHFAPGYSQGQRGGSENVTLSVSELPAHRHTYRATCDDASTTSPDGAKLAPTAVQSYRGTGELSALHADAVGNRGGSQVHNNMQPYLTLTFIIALQGVYPSRS